jgi:hypothetical protein
MSKIKERGPRRGPRIHPHTAPRHIDWDKHTPVFSLRHVVATHGVDGCSNTEKASILDAFSRRSGLTWTELKSAPRHGLGTEKLDVRSLKVSIPSCVTPDTTIIAFRCIGKAPMIGFRDEDRFHILWVDRGFDCYDHG